METSGHTLYQFHDFQLLDVNNRPVGTVDWIWADDERGSAAFLGVHLQWLRGPPGLCRRRERTLMCSPARSAYRIRGTNPCGPALRD